ncbi:putative transferase CAF17 homolog, mitochondrial [Cephus cinctus]|uniref:Transferase CAF17 homolog, mitochondrial n=1 Tax=Cephus cinctus TaxID=211228 RepID=A0AAJ7FGV2_CEPCN|nr:putative transferase CAF17 homolog, mitochondrial [Cephus cinctus]
MMNKSSMNMLRLLRNPLVRTNVIGIHWYDINAVRYNSMQSTSRVLECLENRSLVRVAGSKVSEFLQGLITNDMRHFEEGAANMYALFLNIKGRVMYDSIIYRGEENEVYYIECDSQIVSQLQKHLKMFKVRRKVDIDSLEDTMKIWVAFDSCLNPTDKNNISEYGKPQLEGRILPCGTLNRRSSKQIDNIRLYEDPRLFDLGLRILTESNVSKDEIIKHLGPVATNNENLMNYKAFRYKLGIGEGIDDLPPGKPFPLEINCDYLHGISFHKGCYIGQELTARTHHTGVVRKRLMPIIFDQIPCKTLEYDEKIYDETGRVVGKFRGREKTFGLGLIRIAEARNAKTLIISDVTLKVIRPLWWAQELRNEKISADS